MKWTRQYTVIAGLALIGLANGVALGGAAYNRSGEPESTLSLTERELRPPYVWTGRKENSGLALRLQWRVLQGDKQPASLASMAPDGGGSPAWLDESKMTSLGFDMTPSPQRGSGNGIPAYQRQLPREIFVVLELNGSAYRMALDRAAMAAKEAETKSERGDGKKLADEVLDREARQSSRLFAVDAGLDHGALRNKFGDRSRYAIVLGQIRPTWLRREGSSGAGIITGLSAATVNVPLEMRSIFEGVTPDSYLTPNGLGHFEARVAFGQRLEPWLVSAATHAVQ